MIAAIYIPLGIAICHFLVALGLEEMKSFFSQRRIAREHNCKSTKVERPWDFAGIFKVYDMTRNLIHETALSNMDQLFHRYGSTFASRILFQKVYFTSQPENIRQILVSRFSDYNASDVRVHLFKPITAHGIFALDGAEWKQARNIYRDIFSRTKDIFDLDLQERCYQQFRQQLPVNQPFDIQPLFLKLILDLTTSFGMGVSAESLAGEKQPENKKIFVESLMYSKKVMARDGFFGPVHVFLSKKKFYKSCHDVHVYTEQIIQDALVQRSLNRKLKARIDQGESNGQIKSLLQGLMESTDSVVDLRDGVVTILIAGIDSVTALLSTTFYLLARHPDAFNKLRASIVDTIGTEPPTHNQLRNLTYLRYVFNEAMRVYPPVPFNARTAICDTWLPSGGGPDAKSGVVIRKGSRVIFSSWVSHRDVGSFGEDSLEFRPERWENLKAEALGFVPFNLGPRACLGQQFALLEASYAAVRLIQDFGQIINHDSQPWTEKIGLNLFNKNGVRIELKEI